MILNKKLIINSIIVFVIITAAILLLLFFRNSIDSSVKFKDSYLEEVVREILENENNPILKNDLLKIMDLDASNRKITSLEGIEYFNNLVSLNLEGNSIKDISALSSLDNLERLNLRDNRIEDISALGNMASLKILNLRKNNIKDITALKSASNLEQLNLRNNNINDISSISGLKKLVYLNIHSDNDIKSIKPIVNLTGLQTLIMKNVKAEQELGLLSGLVNLKRLNMSFCSLTDISALASFVSLEELELSNNSVRDITALSNMSSLKILDLMENDIEDITALEQMGNLEQLNLRYNDIVNLSPLKNLVSLQELNLGQNYIEDITPVKNLVSLKKLDLRENYIVDVGPLKNLVSLQELNLRNNDVTDIGPLAYLKNLTYLNIHSNYNVISIEPVSGLTNLRTLIMRSVPVGNQINVLQNLTSLERLNLRNCGITNATVIGKLMNLGALQDDDKSAIKAEVNLLENSLSFNDAESYALIASNWGNVTYRYPVSLAFSGETCSKPQFSCSGGFYDKGFTLELSVDDADATIFYTLDGSEPSPFNTNGKVYYYKNQYPKEPGDAFGELISRTYITIPYASPISIGNSNDKNEGIVGINKTISDELIDPKGDVLNGTVVRAIAYKEGSLPSQIVTNTYFIGEDLQERYHVPVISVVTGEYSFFDYYTGIYVVGELFDRWREANPEEPYYWHNPTNYHQHGLKWEREASIEMYGTNNEMLLNQLCSIRIHGGTSSQRPNKSLRIYAKETDNEGLFKIQLFESKEIDNFKTIILRNSGNDCGVTHFRDALMQSLLQDIKIDTQAYQPAILFINGVYWGIYNIRERIDPYYLYYNHDVDPENIYLLTRDAVVKVGDESWYQYMIEYIKKNDITENSVYDYINTLMDTDNFLNYYTAQIYFGNDDWLRTNILYWRLKTEEYEPDAPYGHDGRWRWILYDTDHGFGLRTDYTHNTLEYATLDNWSTFLFRRLLQNEYFRNSFVNHNADYLNTIFSPDVVIEQINKMHDNLAPLIQEHINRWGSPASVEQWEKEVEVLRDFARNRPFYLRKYIVEYFDLSGTANISINTDLSKGTVIINSVDISKYIDSGKEVNWNGIYFKDVPIEIAAVAKPGYTFSGWEGLDTKDETFSVILNEDLDISAIFVKD